MRNGSYRLIFTTKLNDKYQPDVTVTVKDGVISGANELLQCSGNTTAIKASLKVSSISNDDAVDLELKLEDHTNHYLFKAYLIEDKSIVIHGQFNFIRN